MNRSGEQRLLLGEWACLGILYQGSTHGFAIAARLRPDGDVGRVWSLTRPLTYRSIDQLMGRGYVSPVGSEPGRAGPNRTMLAATRAGRAQFRRWLHTPVAHLRDVRSELLLKLVLAEQCDIDVTDMLIEQRVRFEQLAVALGRDIEAGRIDSAEPAGTDRCGRGLAARERRGDVAVPRQARPDLTVWCNRRQVASARAARSESGGVGDGDDGR